MSANRTGDHGPAEFQAVYEEFHAKIRRYLDRMVGASDADDVTQEVFTKVSQALPQFRGDSSLSTWIYRIATNTAYDRLRSASSRQGVGVVPLEPETPDDSPCTEQELVREEMNECIDGFVERLPANYRSVVVLSDYEGLTNQEIADALDITVETVKIRLHRGRSRLRKDLQGGCDFYRDGRNEFACEPKRMGVSRRD